LKEQLKKEFIKQHQANFTTIGKLEDKFHYNFREGMTTHLAGYRGVNLNEITNA
jgi:hypothetical protein